MTGFTQAVTLAFQQYFTFSGRSSRAEFWWFALFSLLGGVVLGIADAFMGTMDASGQGLFSGLFRLAVFIPSLALGCRRLHDINRTGWWQLLWLLFFPGIILLVWAATPGDSGAIRYSGSNASSVGSTSRFCPQCSTAVPSGSSFCTLCGHMIGTS